MIPSLFDQLGDLRRKLGELGLPFDPRLSEQKNRIVDLVQFEAYILEIENAIREDIADGQSVNNGEFIIGSLSGLKAAATAAKGMSITVLPQILTPLLNQLEKIASDNPALRKYLENRKILSRSLTKVALAQQDAEQKNQSTVVNTGGKDFVQGYKTNGDQYDTGVGFPPGFPFHNTGGRLPSFNSGSIEDDETDGPNIVSYRDKYSWITSEGEVTEYTDAEGTKRRRTEYNDGRSTTDVIVYPTVKKRPTEGDSEALISVDLTMQKGKITTIDQVIRYLQALIDDITNYIGYSEEEADNYIEIIKALTLGITYVERAKELGDSESEVLSTIFDKLATTAKKYPDLNTYLRKSRHIRDLSRNTPSTTHTQNTGPVGAAYVTGRVNTGGGAFHSGDVNIPGGDYVGGKQTVRGQIRDGDYVVGRTYPTDKVGGVYSVGDAGRGSGHTYAPGAIYIEPGSHVEGNIIAGNNTVTEEWTDLQGKQWREVTYPDGRKELTRLR